MMTWRKTIVFCRLHSVPRTQPCVLYIARPERRALGPVPCPITCDKVSVAVGGLDKHSV
jgi:hypothetical protein